MFVRCTDCSLIIYILCLNFLTNCCLIICYNYRVSKVFLYYYCITFYCYNILFCLAVSALLMDSIILLYKVVSFFYKQLKISENAGTNWLYFSGKLYECLSVILVYFVTLESREKAASITNWDQAVLVIFC